MYTDKKVVLNILTAILVFFFAGAANSTVLKGPYLIYEGANSEMTVLWQLDSTQLCTISWSDISSINSGSFDTVESGGGTFEHQHKYTITGLEPGTFHSYQVSCSEDTAAGDGSFTTAPDDNSENVKLMVYGDTQGNPDNSDSVYAQMINTYTLDPGYQTLTLHAGDWNTNSDSEADWSSQFFNPGFTNTKEFLANMVINGARGNHEYSAILYPKYYPYPYETGGLYWSFDYGPAHIAVIDQFVDYSPGSEQYAWLVNDLATSQKKWKFLIFHEPGWSAGAHPPTLDVVNHIHPLAVATGVDIIFAGHHHYYARAVVDGIQHVTTGGGGGSLMTPNPDYDNIVATAMVHHFCELDIQGDDLYFISRDESGVVLDSFHMTNVPQENQSPEVDSGADQSTILPDDTVLLSALVIDYTLPLGPLQVEWNHVGGTGTGPVVFSAPGRMESSVSFGAIGTYVLELTVDDGEFQQSDSVTVTVVEPGDITSLAINPAVVSVFTDHEVLFSSTGTDIFGNTFPINLNWESTCGTISQSGVYTAPGTAGDCTVTASIGGISTTALVTVTEEPVGPPTLYRVVSASADDAEESGSGFVNLISSDLDMAEDIVGGNQTVGIRFTEIDIPQGATITSGYIEFGTDERSSGPASLSITAEDSDNSAAFLADDQNISGRLTVPESVEWNDIPDWNSLSVRHQTPDIASLVQEVINRTGWASGNALSFIITGTGTRVAPSYDGVTGGAPALHLEYAVLAPVNQPPEVDAGANQVISLPVTESFLDATVTDDGFTGGTLNVNWSQVNGPDTAVFSNPDSIDTSVTVHTIGTYTFELEADDGEYLSVDSVTVTLTEQDLVAPASPTNLGASPESGYAISLSWTEATDNIGVTGYDIYRDNVLVATTVGTSFTDRNLLPLSEYTYEVAALDAAGNISIPAGPVSVFTLEASEELVIQISDGTNDAEESEIGLVNLRSSDLELIDDTAGGNQTVGLRFPEVTIPQGATVTGAYIEFETDETGSGPASLFITVEDVDDAAPFTIDIFNISERSTIPAGIDWNAIDDWNGVNERHQTPDLSPIVQEVINRTGWISGNAISFILTGTGTRTAESFDGEPLGAPSLHLEYSVGPPVNQPPVVEAGENQLINLPETTAFFNASVSDDGLPDGTLSITWRQLDGPDSAEFSDAGSIDSSVTVPTVGNYIFELEVDDGEYLVSDTVTVSLMEPDLEQPSAPTDLTPFAESGYEITLLWTGSTDNVGVAGYEVYRDGVLAGTTTETTFSDGNLLPLSDYEYVVAAYDAAGNLSALSDPATGTTLEASEELILRIDSGDNDAEESVSGAVNLISSDLELSNDGGAGDQTIGLRFINVTIPQGATVTGAYIDFETDETSSGPASLLITAEDSDNTAPFSTDTFNISDRFTVSSFVEWNDIADWTAVNERHQTPDLAPLIQEVVNRAGWVSGNALSIIITGTGTRTAESYNGEPLSAPALYLEYSSGPLVNQPPEVDAGGDQLINLPVSAAILDATVSDDGLPDGTLAIAWRLLDGPDGVDISDTNTINPTVTFFLTGDYILELEVDDGEFLVTDTVTVTLMEEDVESPDIPADLSVFAESGYEVSLFWTASTDNVGVAGYEVYRDSIPVGTTSDSNFSDTGLEPLTEYAYTIAAFDAAGNISDLSDQVLIMTLEPSEELVIRITDGVDDVEEFSSGIMNLTSSDLELVNDGGAGNQTIGLRFVGVDIPQGAIITSAFIEFETDETRAGSASVMITTEDVDDAAGFTTDLFNVSSRFAVPLFVEWNDIPDWNVVDERHQTPDLSSIVQEVVNRSGWLSGNAMTFLLTGTGTRTAESFNGEPLNAPALYVEFIYP